ncbi:hypothetical protein HPB47_019090, partial [Ixodes persulcatus]
YLKFALVFPTYIHSRRQRKDPHKQLSTMTALLCTEALNSTSPLHAGIAFAMVTVYSFWCLDADCILGAPFYIGGAITALNSRILAIRPPISFCRLPRPISERAHWKANEWQYWLLFYSLPCLKDILPTRYFHHFALLCQGMFLLLGTKVTELDVREAERLLFRFVDRIVQLYGHSA